MNRMAAITDTAYVAISPRAKSSLFGNGRLGSCGQEMQVHYNFSSDEPFKTHQYSNWCPHPHPWPVLSPADFLTACMTCNMTT